MKTSRNLEAMTWADFRELFILLHKLAREAIVQVEAKGMARRLRLLTRLGRRYVTIVANLHMRRDCPKRQGSHGTEGRAY